MDHPITRYESRSWRITEVLGRHQPFSVWYNDQVVGFREDYADALAYVESMRQVKMPAGAKRTMTLAEEQTWIAGLTA